MKKKVNFKKVILVILSAYICFIFISQQSTMGKIKGKINDKNVEMSKLKQKNQNLKDEVEMSKSDAYTEKLAREKLKLIKKGEIPVINSSN